MIKCEECKREFLGDPITPGKVFVCRFCMGHGLDPNKFHGKPLYDPASYRPRLASGESELRNALKTAVKWWKEHSKNRLYSLTEQEREELLHCLKLIGE